MISGNRVETIYQPQLEIGSTELFFDPNDVVEVFPDEPLRGAKPALVIDALGTASGVFTVERIENGAEERTIEEASQWMLGRTCITLGGRASDSPRSLLLTPSLLGSQLYGLGRKDNTCGPGRFGEISTLDGRLRISLSPTMLGVQTVVFRKMTLRKEVA